VRQALNKSDDENLTCLTFDELIDRDADFTPYLYWLEREISKREIDRYYVDLGCTKGEFDADTRTLRGTSKYSVADGGIDRYIDRWLENPVTEHVSILGEFGTGKTWFAFHYAGKCLRAYRAAKSKGMPRPRLPLVIPLRDYAKALNVENVFAGFFYTQHNIRLNSEVFDRLNQMGKLLLIFDGFDEMADKIDTQKMTDNFWELAKVVTTNAKVILTCRTEHFPTAQDGRENFGGERIPSTVNKIAVAPKFETLELMKFDDEQSWVMQTALNQDCQFLYSGSRDDTIKEWRLTDSSCQRTFHSFQDGVMTIALSTDKNLLSPMIDGCWDGRICESMMAGVVSIIALK
jgi:predicted NACHT family NTPase